MIKFMKECKFPGSGVVSIFGITGEGRNNEVPVVEYQLCFLSKNDA